MSNVDIGKKFLSDLKLHSDYLKWVPEKGRYETWEEACEDVINNTYRRRYPQKLVQPMIDQALHSYKRKLVLASQRSLQYRSAQIDSHNGRQYNCCTTYCYSPDVFARGFYVLLCGEGLGVSLHSEFVSQLPALNLPTKGTKTFVVQDTIEGWADAANALISSFCASRPPVKEYQGYSLKFDTSLIRPKGSFISGGFKAPGPDGLIASLSKIETLLTKAASVGEFTDIVAYDIFMHLSNAVLSGGIRRAAMNVMFGDHQIEMMNAKIGNWFEENPQRARSNNSVMLLRDTLTKEHIQKVVDRNIGQSDLGFVFVNNIYEIFNPCQPAWATVLTPNGISTIGEIKEGSTIWGGDKWVTVTKKWSTGVKEVNAYNTNAGVFYGTKNHRVISNGERVEAGDATSIDVCSGLPNYVFPHITSVVVDGLVIGDGGRNTPEGGVEVLLNIGEKDQDYFSSEVAPFIGKSKPWDAILHSVDTSILYSEVPKLNTRIIPERFVKADPTTVASFLRGLYSANGSICGNRVTLKSTSLPLIRQTQLMLSSLGIKSYITTNKPTSIKWHNGTYVSKESYDLNITTDRHLFARNIGFIQKYKQDKLEEVCSKIKAIKPKQTFEVTSVEFVSEEEVFDITVDSEEHTYWTGGLLVSNCYEIKFGFYHKIQNKKEAVFQKCNLNEINASACIDEDGAFCEDMFYRACVDAAVIGTMQAGVCNFPYLGQQTNDIVAGEALLGVSITGWMDRPELFDPAILQRGAEIVKVTNRTMAHLIGINPAARTTCVKPSGNSSVILSTTSGIHPEHSPRFFRIMQLNKEAQTAKWLEENIPELLEESVWSATKSDYGVFVPVTASPTAIFKSEMVGVKHLELVRMVQENWVKPGKTEELCYDPTGDHNVSVTVIIDDVDAIVDYIHEHRDSFTAVSFLSPAGDKDYNQAPFTSVLTSSELLATYGDGVLFASGLIVDGLHYFDGDLWRACEHVKNRSLKFEGSRDKCLLQKDWVRRAKKFAKNYHKGKIDKMIYCLKDVHLWHKWNSITQTFKPVDFGTILTEPTYSDVGDYAAAACSGGACEI